MQNNRNEEEQHVERVIVSARLRPFTEEEYLRDRQTSIETFDTVNKVVLVKKEFEKKVFNFDHLLDPQIQQKDVYNTVARDVVEGVLKGYNGTIFAYGQTGTGKTYTMLGQPTDKQKRGIIPRSLEHIFETAVNDKKYTYEIRIAYLQIYMEILQDLIEPANTDIKIRESPESGVFITGNTWIAVKSVDECLEVLGNAEKNRVFAFTNLNATSSRSHAVFIVKLEKRLKMTIDQIETLEKQNNFQNTSIITSILYLVDLAGSERVKKSKISGERLEEAISINSSLTALGKCIHALTDSRTSYVPFRDSKLTRILQDSLGGNSKTALIVNIGPGMKNIEETLSSLYFGSRAMKVKNRPIINKQKDYHALSMQLQSELDAKDDEIHRMQIKLADLLEEVNLIKNEYEKQKLISESSGKLMKNLSKTYNTDNLKGILEKIEVTRQEELEQLEKRYRDIITDKDKQHKEFLEEIDQLMLEQENEINDLKQKNESLNFQLEKMQHEKEQIKNLLETERFQHKERQSSFEVDKKNLQITLQQLQNQLDQSSRKEKDYLSKILELEASKGERNLPRPYIPNDKGSRTALDDQWLEKENLNERYERPERDLARENEEKARTTELIQNLQAKVSTLQGNIETLKKEKIEYMNKERQNYLKVQDLEATIIKFGDQKNKALEELERKEQLFRRERAQFQDGLSNKDDETIEKMREYKETLEQTEQYYTQQIRTLQVQMEENDIMFQQNLNDLNNRLEEREQQIEKLNEYIQVADEAKRSDELKAANAIREVECQLLYKNQEFLNIEKRLNELNHLLQEKDDQITQLRNFIESQEGTYEEKGAKSSIRISELEQQLQHRSNEYYRLQDEKIKIEQELRLEIQRLEDEYNNLASQNMSNQQYIESLKEEMGNMKSEHGQVLTKHKEDTNYGRNLANSIKEREREIEEIRHKMTLSAKEKEREIEDLRHKLTTSMKEKEREIEELKHRLMSSTREKDREIEELKVSLYNAEAQNAHSTSRVAEDLELREVERAGYANKMQETEEKIAAQEHDIVRLRQEIQDKEELIQNYEQEIHKRDVQIQELSSQLHNTTHEHTNLRNENEEQKLTLQDSLRQKDEENKQSVQKLHGLEKEKEHLVTQFEEIVRSKEEVIQKLQQQVHELERHKLESKVERPSITPSVNEEKEKENASVPARSRNQSIREIEMEGELQAMENETLKMITEELREENKKLKAMLKKYRGADPGEDSFTLMEESRTMMEGPSMLSEMVLKNDNEDDRIEDKSALVNESISKTNPMEALQQNLQQEIFQKEILMEEKEILSNRIKELEAELASMSEKLPIKSVVEAERAQTTLKRAERDKEEAEQTIKGLKKVIETNQNQFSIQMKKYDKQIQQLNEQIEELKSMNDGFELQMSENEHIKEMLESKEKELANLTEEVAKLTQQNKELNQKLKDLQADLKIFNTNYERLQSENFNLLAAVEKSKYSVLEHDGILQEKELEMQQIAQEVDENKHINNLLQEKVQKLEGELRKVTSKKTHLEFEMKAANEQAAVDICQIVLDNCIMALQMQEMDKELREVRGLNKIKTLFTNQVSNPSQKWLQTVGQAYLKKNSEFSIQNFYTFIDNFSTQQASANVAFMQYDDAFSAFTDQKDRKAQQLNGPRGAGFAEVQAVLDDMILIVEVQDEIQNQMRLNMNWIGIDLQVERELDKNLVVGPPRNRLTRAKEKDLTLEEACKAVTRLNTSNIFTNKYIRKMKASIHSPNLAQKKAVDFIICDPKLLQKILAINEGLSTNAKTNNDLVVNLTTLFLNTYNYCEFIKEKNDFQEKVIKDLQGVIQTCIRYFTFKEVELKIAEKTKRMLLKRYKLLIKAFKTDKKTFEDFTLQVQEKEKIEAAVLRIQRFYRLSKEREIKKFAFKKDFELLKERKNSEKIAQNYQNFGAKTGKFLIQQSMNHVDIVFNSLREIFVQKTSLRYKKFQQHYSKKDNPQ